MIGAGIPVAFLVSRESSPPSLERIAAMVNDRQFNTESERLDFVREWVHDHSIHQIDAEHDEYAFDTHRVLDMMWLTYDSSANPAHLSCGPRSLVMREILTAIGVASRLVIILSDEHDAIRTHTLVDVWNTETGAWESHDPDFDVYYVERGVGTRIGVARLVGADLRDASPVSRRGPGWETNRVTHLRDR